MNKKINDEEIEIIDIEEDIKTEKTRKSRVQKYANYVEENQVLNNTNKISKKEEKKKIKEEKKANKEKTLKDKKTKKEKVDKAEKAPVINDSDTSKVKVKKLKKGVLVRAVFCFVSIAFIIGCCVFYGMRFLKFYKIYNPKDENGKAVALLSNKIISSSSLVYEGDGIYINGGSYIYKGVKVDNYIKYGNLLWRIVKINADKTIDIILDKSINNLKWNSSISDYSDSDINKYLNDEFISYLDKSLLTTSTVCKDIINDVKSISCKTFDTSNLVRLLNVDEFINSKVSEKSFISDENDIWLSSRGDKNVWVINGDSLSYAETTNTYEIKPVVTLRNSTVVNGGKGTAEDPYIIEKDSNEVGIGDHIKLGDDIWTVYKTSKDNLYLTLSSLYKDGNKTYRFSTTKNIYSVEEESSLAKYLNEDYYKTLSYKDKLLDTEWYIGTYEDSYKDIYKEKITAKVAIPSVVDLKFDNGVEGYYLINGSKDNKSLLFKNDLIESKPTLSRALKPSICIKNEKIKSGTGTLKDPFILEG